MITKDDLKSLYANFDPHVYFESYRLKPLRYGESKTQITFLCTEVCISKNGYARRMFSLDENGYPYVSGHTKCGAPHQTMGAYMLGTGGGYLNQSSYEKLSKLLLKYHKGCIVQEVVEIPPDIAKQIRLLYANGEKTKEEVGEQFGIAPATVYRVVNFFTKVLWG
jgi:helix-turn-helix resolvase-like protein